MAATKKRVPKSIVVRGRLTGPRHVELDESVTGLAGAVEVALRAAPRSGSAGKRPDWFATGRRALARWLDENPY